MNNSAECMLIHMPQRFELEGIVPALLTPLDEHEELLESSLRRHVSRLVEEGVYGLYVLGTTGLGPYLSIGKRKLVAEIVHDELNGKKPMVLHVGAAGSEDVIELGRHAGNIGADAVAVVTPFYYKPSESRIIEYYEWIASKIELPIFIYNIPQNTGINLRPQTVSRIAEIDGVVGIKDSSRDLSQIAELRFTLPDSFLVFNGADALLYPSILLGVNGLVSGLSNVLAARAISIYRKIKAGKVDEARTEFILYLRACTLFAGNPIPSYLEALSLKNVDSGRPPRVLSPLTEEEKRKIRGIAEYLTPKVERQT